MIFKHSDYYSYTPYYNIHLLYLVNKLSMVNLKIISLFGTILISILLYLLIVTNLSGESFLKIDKHV